MKTELRNYWIFPSLVVGCLSLAYFYENWWLLGAAAYFLLVIIRKKKWLLLLPLLFCGFFCCWKISEISILTASDAVPYEGELQILSDTVKINGDMVSFDGRDSKDQLLRCSYFPKEDLLMQWQTFQKRPTQLRVKGELKAAVGQRNLAGFDQQDYYRSQGLFAGLTIKTVTAQGQQQQHSFRSLRAFLIDQIQMAFPQHLATYLNALLTGFCSDDFQELQAELSASGIMHLFSISGMHIIFLLGSLEYLFRRASLTSMEMLPILLGIAAGLFILLGGSSSVLRALVMFLFAKYTRRYSNLFSSLDRFAIVLLLLSLLDPLLLMKTGGQLSVLMAFLLLMLPEVRTRGGNLATATWLTVVAAPVIASYFHDWPLFGGILTLIYLPIFTCFYLPIGLMLLFLSLIGACPQWLKTLIAGLFNITEWPLHFLDWSALRIGSLPQLLVLILVVSGLLILESRQKQWRVIVVCLLIPWLWQRLDPTTAVFFVDIGQGDAIVFKAPFLQETILLDTSGKIQFGKRNGRKKTNADYTLIPFLKSQGITKIDKIILTHSDTDHLGDLEAIVAEFKVDAIYVGLGSKDDPQVTDRLQGRKIPIYEVQSGDLIEGHFNLQVLAPKKPGKGENEDSIVLYTQIKSQLFLFTGDLDQAGELRLLKQYPRLHADVLKVGHHGSRTSTHPAFVETVGVQEAVISAGKNNRFGHPHPEVLSVLAETKTRILRTDHQHMIYYRWYPWQRQTEAAWLGAGISSAALLVLETR